MSLFPTPTGRNDAKYRVRPSALIAGLYWSPALTFASTETPENAAVTRGRLAVYSSLLPLRALKKYPVFSSGDIRRLASSAADASPATSTGAPNGLPASQRGGASGSSPTHTPPRSPDAIP